MTRHDRRNSRAGSIAKIYGGVSVGTTSLSYPVTVTTGTGQTDGLTVVCGSSPSGFQAAIQVKYSSGTTMFQVGNYGGPSAFGVPIRVYNPAGTAWAGFDGSLSPAPLQMVDGASAQGSKVSSGSGPPRTATLPGGAGAVGDFYYCRSSAYLVAAAYSAAQSGTSVAAGSGTPVATGIVNGTPAVGDLVVVASCNTNASETMTIGATAGITATGTDGGYTVGSTNYVKMFSHVIQAGDISSNVITATSSSHTTGTQRRLMMWIFRHPSGWSTTGSKYGCAMYSTPASYVGSSSSNVSLSLTGPSSFPSPTVAVFAEYLPGSPISPSILFDGGNSGVPASNQTPELPPGSSAAFALSKPGAGTNYSAAVGYPVGGSSVVVTAQPSSSHTAMLAQWKPNGTSNPIMYVCTTAGSPGTWTQII